MFFEAMDLYRTLHLKSNTILHLKSNPSSHFQNNFKRTKNCPIARANMNEPGKQRAHWRYHWSVTYVTQEWRGYHEKFSFIVT